MPLVSLVSLVSLASLVSLEFLVSLVSLVSYICLLSFVYRRRLWEADITSIWPGPDPLRPGEAPILLPSGRSPPQQGPGFRGQRRFNLVGPHTIGARFRDQYCLHLADPMCNMAGLWETNIA